MRIGLPCPRCIKGQLVIFHLDDYVSCFQCGHEPAPKTMAAALADFDVVFCSCGRVLRRTNRSGLCVNCMAQGLPCRSCGGPVGAGNTSGLCWGCSQRQHQEDLDYRDKARAYGRLGAEVRYGKRSDGEPELSAGGKPRGALGVD